MNRRRVLAVVTIAAVGALGLTGCQQGPDTAAYVGDARLTTAQVDGMVKEFTTAQKSKDDKVAQAGLRTQIVSSWVIGQLGKDLVSEGKLPPAQVDVAASAEQFGLAENSQLTRIIAEFKAYQAVIVKAPAVQPTDADYSEVLAQAVKLKAIPEAAQIADMRKALPPATLASALGVKQLLLGAQARHTTDVNPMFGPIAYGVLQLQNGAGSLVQVPLGATRSAVTDLPVVEPGPLG
ncbi:hypothetical protein Lfu02_28320 [Longispora fulva]|uniref:Lipoprotein n=1 Tax=Longispora fulva TaxID=619741 RepID=A0A8J7GL86_9ACTN|nr:hypothetical protein [Longispora fulva]MBG6138967.1 hypothetical protein [Longispora fulva]GIG58460.1 hypothetical protein Lfu02_28320 [Longispora fulva]